MYRVFAILCLFAVSVSSHAEIATREYQNYLVEDVWKVSPGKFSCHLTQKIPLYGEIVFSHRSDDRMAAVMRVFTPPPSEGFARLYSVPPEWKSWKATLDLGRLPYATSTRPFFFDNQMARRLMKELEQGHYPTLYYEDWKDSLDDVKVAISPVGFRQAVVKLQECVAALNPLDYESATMRVALRTGVDTDSADAYDLDVGAGGAGGVGSAEGEQGAGDIFASSGGAASSSSAGAPTGATTGAAAGATAGTVAGAAAGRAGAVAQARASVPKSAPASALRNEATTPIAADGIPTNLFSDRSGETTLFFDTDKSELTEKALRTLNVLVDFVHSNPEYNLLLVTGHADSRGSDAYNMELGERRANSVREYLLARGVDPAGISLFSEGARTPVASNDTPEGMARNRRAHIQPQRESSI